MTQNTSPEEFPKRERLFKAEISRETCGGGGANLFSHFNKCVL